MATITDEMKSFAHTHLQNKTESDYDHALQSLRQQAQASSDRHAELMADCAELIRNGSVASAALIAERDAAGSDAQFCEGVAEYIQTNKSLLTIAPDAPAPTAATPSTEPTQSELRELYGARREKLSIPGAVAATALFPASLVVPKVRKAIVGRTKEILGIRPPLGVNEERPKYLQTTRGKVVAGVTAGAIALTGASMIFGDKDAQAPTQDPNGITAVTVDENGCELTDHIAIEEGEQSFEASGGDPVAAVELANEMLADYGAPSGNCTPEIVTEAQQTAADHIAGLAGLPGGNVASTTVPQPRGENRPTPVGGTPINDAKPDLTISCVDEDGDGRGVLDYDGQIVADSVTRMPSDMWEGQPCDVPEGTEIVVGLDANGNTIDGGHSAQPGIENVKIVGRGL